MNYIEWRFNLQGEIALLEQSEQETILKYYDELFQDKTEEGFSESEILKAFGSPKDVADELTMGLGSVGTPNDTPEYKASRAQQFKENFDRFQEKFNTRMNAMLVKAGVAVKKFGKIVKTKFNEINENLKNKNM